MRSAFFKVLDYFYDNKTPRTVLYWASWILLCHFAFSLPTLEYAGVLLCGLLLHWSGLITGGALADEARNE